MEQRGKEKGREPLDELEERLRRDEPTDVPEPEPGKTAPLDEATEEEQRRQPVGIMPGAGPEGPDARQPADREVPDAERGESSGEAGPDAERDRETPEPEPDAASRPTEGPGDAEPDADPTRDEPVGDPERGPPG